MPKVGMNRINSNVGEFGGHIFASDGGVLFCKMFKIKVNSDKRFCVTQHLKTEKHARAANRKAKKYSSTQPLITTPSSRKFDFYLRFMQSIVKIKYSVGKTKHHTFSIVSGKICV